MIKNFKGISAEELIKALKEVPGNTKICIDVLGNNFPIKQVEQCTYYDWDNGKRVQGRKGILVR
ncbi:hypothetical protein FDB25_15875 [Clostridium botulinum]|nr:hypothetical protein [Clostridium botulinum]